jgi:SulP family sulfate permease
VSGGAERDTLRRRLAALRPTSRDELTDDVIGGLSLVVVLIPQAMAFSALVGVPPVAGLHAALLSLLAYAAFGSVPLLSFGPIAIPSLLTGTAVAALSGGDPARAVALAGALAVMVGLTLLLLRVLRASTLVDVISAPVLIGFVSAAGLTIATSQLRALLGITADGSDRFLAAFLNVVAAGGTTHPLTGAIGVASVVALLVGRRVAPRLPTVLVLAAIAIPASVLLDLGGRGVALVGEVPSGLPLPRLPDVDLDDLRALAGSAVAIAVVGFTQTVALAKAIAARQRRTVEADREFVAAGTANLLAGLFGGFPTGGSLSMSSVLEASRARTRNSLFWTAAFLAVVLLLLTAVLEPLPRTILAALIITAALRFVDVAGFRSVLRVSRADALVALATFLGTLALGVLNGLAIGVGVNLVVHLSRRMRPGVVELGRVEGTTEYRNAAVYPTVGSDEGVLLRLDGAFDFLNAGAVGAAVRRAAAEHPGLRWILLEASGVSELDATGLGTLEDLMVNLGDAGVELHLALLRSPQRATVERAGPRARTILDRCHPSVTEGLRALGVAADDPVLAPAAGERRPEGFV